MLTPQGIPQQKNDSDCGVFVLEVRHYSFPPLQLSSSPLFITYFSYYLPHILSPFASCLCFICLFPGRKIDELELCLQRLSCPGFRHNLIFAQVPKGAKETGEKILSFNVAVVVDHFPSLLVFSVLVCQYCRCLSVKQPLLFSQEDMPRIRKRIYKELCDCRLDD